MLDFVHNSFHLIHLNMFLFHAEFILFSLVMSGFHSTQLFSSVSMFITNSCWNTDGQML